MTNFKRLTRATATEFNPKAIPSSSSKEEVRRNIGDVSSERKKKRGQTDDSETTSTEISQEKILRSKKAKATLVEGEDDDMGNTPHKSRNSAKNSELNGNSRNRFDTPEIVHDAIDLSVASNCGENMDVESRNQDIVAKGARLGNALKPAITSALNGTLSKSSRIRPGSLKYNVYSDPVIPANLIDKHLVELGLYNDLPNIGVEFLPVHPYPPESEDDVVYLNYSDVVANLSDDAKLQIVEGLRFRRYKWAMNLGRVDLEETFVSDDRLRDSETKKVVIGIMTGVVTRCELVEDGNTANVNMPQPVHQISIIPFGLEFCRNQTYWIKKFNCEGILGQVGSIGVNFRTMIKNKSGNSVLSPRTDSGTVSTRYKVSKAPPGRRLPNVYASVPFETPIQIYDGRHDGECPFMFTASDFEGIRSWPVLRDSYESLVDVPNDSIVMVAYTLNTYPGTQGTGPHLSTNIQFVVVLNIPQDPSESE